MSKSEVKRIKLLAEMRGEFTAMDDGYYYWFPSQGGGLSAATLRTLADILDEKNRDWDTHVKKREERHDG